MKQTHKYFTNVLIFLIVSAIIIPYILRIEIIKAVIVDWLSFANNNDYKIAYIQLIGSVIGTFISLYGALWVQKEQQRVIDEKKKKECARNIYIELSTCFRELQNIFKDTKVRYDLKEIRREDIEKFAEIAVRRELSLRKNWRENLVGAGNVFSDFEKNMIYKYYLKLQVIQQALESKSVDEVQEVYVPYICHFIKNDGDNLYNDIDDFIKRIDVITKE